MSRVKFSRISAVENNFQNVLFTSLGKKTIFKRSLLLKKRKNSFLYEVTPNDKGSKTENGRLVSFNCILFHRRVKKVKISHSLTAVGQYGLEANFILGTADDRQSPSFSPLSFLCLISPTFNKVPIYCWAERESFPIVRCRAA